MVRISNKCPPGVLCLTPGLLIFGIIAIIIAAGIFLRAPVNYHTVERASPQTTQVSVEAPGDDRYNRAPKPERDWLTRPDLSVIANSPTAIMSTIPTIATQGIPETYQSMGVLKTGEGKILPLYGRRTSSRSDRFQYYSRTDGYNPVQLPIRYNNYNCVDDVGCNELFDGDTISLVPTGERASITLYRLSGPTYVPII